VAGVAVRTAIRRSGLVAVDQRVKPGEREVLGDVLITQLRALVVVARLAGGNRVEVLRVRRRVGACRARSAARRVLAVGDRVQVLGVALPGLARSVELVEQRRHVRGIGAAVAAHRGVDAAAGVGLPVIGVRSQRATRRLDTCVGVGVVVYGGAIGLHVLLGRLAADQGLVVALAEVAGAVVVLQQHPLGGECLPQIGVLVEPGERGVVALVLQDDQPGLLDGAGGEVACRDLQVLGRTPRRRGSGGRGRDERDRGRSTRHREGSGDARGPRPPGDRSGGHVGQPSPAAATGRRVRGVYQ